MKSILTILTAFVLFGISFTFSSCKQCCKKENKPTRIDDKTSSEDNSETTGDSTPTIPPSNVVSTPVAPILPPPTIKTLPLPKKLSLDELKSVVMELVESTGKIEDTPLWNANKAADKIFANYPSGTPEAKPEGWAYKLSYMCYARLRWATDICTNGIDKTNDDRKNDAEKLEREIKAIDSEIFNKLLTPSGIVPERAVNRGVDVMGDPVPDETWLEFDIRSIQLTFALKEMRECMPEADKVWKELVVAVKAYRDAKN